MYFVKTPRCNQTNLQVIAACNFLLFANRTIYIFCFLYLLKIRTFKHYLECKLVRSAAWQQEEIHIDKPCAMSIQWHECCHHVWKNGKIEWRIAPSPRRGRKLLPMSHRQCFATLSNRRRRDRTCLGCHTRSQPWFTEDYMTI